MCACDGDIEIHQPTDGIAGTRDSEANAQVCVPAEVLWSIVHPSLEELCVIGHINQSEVFFFTCKMRNIGLL